MFQIGNRYLTAVKHRRRKTAIDTGLLKQVGEMLIVPGTAGSDDRNGNRLTNQSQLIKVVATLDPVIVHAVQNDLAGAAPLRLAGPGDRVTR